MSNLSTWYTNQYAGPFRSSRLRAPSLLPGNRRPSFLNNLRDQQTTVVVDPTHNPTTVAAATTTANKDEPAKRRETLFGPDIGDDEEPGWDAETGGDGSRTKGEIGVETVKAWVDRARGEEGLHATTTLQALVNLKRPTLTLSLIPTNPSDLPPIEDDQVASSVSLAPIVPPTPLHLLKFRYDATAPNVAVTLTLHTTPTADGRSVGAPMEIYYGIHSGGFNQSFSLPADHAIDLSPACAPLAQESDDDEEAKGNPKLSSTDSEINGDSLRNAQVLEATPPAPVPAPVPTPTRSRFGGLLGRRGYDAEPTPAQLEAGGGGIEMQNVAAEETAAVKAQPERGMRLLIRIEALGASGEPLENQNAQLTHILVTGMWTGGTDAPSSAPVEGPSVDGSGRRIWVIKVARREAVIGSHTFLLKEIYGLSTAATNTESTYPPPASADPYASTPNECIVCLTSPRDVVLLPCRHLVVCRDCAVGMVEFGAGGKVARREETETTEVAGGDAAVGAVGADGAVTPIVPAPAPTPAPRERRKKKAKGWFCPVCRQPYTSLLRLALPTSAKPLRTPAASRMQSRAPSIRAPSIHSLHRVPSNTPTLPDGAERMLEGLRPAGYDVDDDENEEALDSARPQFVIGEEISGSGAVTPTYQHEHPHEYAGAGQAIETVEHAAPPVLEREVEVDAGAGVRASLDEAGKPKAGWKEVV